MQHKRNKKAAVKKAAVDKTTAVDTNIQYLDEQAQATYDVTDADLIEGLEGWLAYLVASDVKPPLMSRESWQRIIKCAKRGVNKGRGFQSGRPPDTYLQKLTKYGALKMTVEFARRRKDELTDQGMSATEATLQAAEEASAYSRTLDHPLAAGTVERQAQRSDL